MKKLLLIPTILAMSLSMGCGDDGTPTDTGPGDAATDTAPPPNNCPFGEAQTEPCCYRSSNAANLDNPQLRVSGVQLTSPPSLSTIVVTALLTQSLDDELFNWLIEADITGTDVAITTGYGIKNADDTFSFTMGTAPGPGDANRWNPVIAAGTIAGESVSAPELNETFTVPVLNEDGSEVTLELPLRNLTLNMADLTEDRSCVGERVLGGRWLTDSGALQAYITVEDADAGLLIVEDAGINTTLCMFTANIMGEPDGTTCADVAQDTWPTQPDALCEPAGCSQDPGDDSVCDPATTCNAWFLQAGFAAQGVVISG